MHLFKEYLSFIYYLLENYPESQASKFNEKFKKC